MKKLLFVTYGGGHAQALIPLVEKLKIEYRITVLALTTARSLFSGDGYQLLSYDELSFLVDSSFQKIGYELTKDSEQSGVVSTEESIAYHGINYLDLVQRFGANETELKYSKLGRQCFMPINFMKQVLFYIKPDLVLATNSPRTERASIEAAGLLGIKSLCLVDLFALQEKEWVGRPGYANKVCVLNYYVKQLLIEEGRSFDEIEVTGNPAFDKLGSQSVISSAQLYKEKVLPRGKKIIFWASQPEPETHPFTKESGGDPDLPLKIERALVDFVDAAKDWALVIRLHPSENRIPFNDSSNVYISNSSEKMTDVLFSCDCLITIASTVALEAHLVGKPVVTVDLSIFTPDAPFSSMGVSNGVSNLADLPKAITDTQYSSEIQVAENLNATQSVIRVIKELLS